MKTPARHHPLRLHPVACGTLSQARSEFSTLMEKLRAARALLAEWHALRPALMNKVALECVPLQDIECQDLRRLVLLLDDMHGHKALGQREREKLSSFIADRAADLLDEGEDDQLAEIYRRHSGGNAEDEERNAQIRQITEALLSTGFDGAVDTSSPDAVFQALQAHFALQTKAAQESIAPHGGQAPSRGRARSERAAALKRERRQAAAAERQQQSVRDIFRELASRLHPDRATDVTERERNTALMARAEAACAAKDMLGLIELQLEVEQIDQATLAKLGGERIQRYNQLLGAQLVELEDEIGAFEATASTVLDANGTEWATPAAVMRTLDRDIADLRTSIAELEERLQSWRDVDVLKAWLTTRPPS